MSTCCQPYANPTTSPAPYVGLGWPPADRQRPSSSAAAHDQLTHCFDQQRLRKVEEEDEAFHNLLSPWVWSELHRTTDQSLSFEQQGEAGQPFDLEGELEQVLNELGSIIALPLPCLFGEDGAAYATGDLMGEMADTLLCCPLSPYSPPTALSSCHSPVSSPSTPDVFGAGSEVVQPTLPTSSSLQQQPPVGPQKPVADVQVGLHHKPRGSGGKYVQLEHRQPIRVTTGKGKRLRLAIESNRPFSWSHITLNLVDVASGAICNDHFTLWRHKSHIDEDPDEQGTRALLEVTVTKLSPELRFYVVLCVDEQGDRWSWEGHSSPFATHNNGKDRSVRLLKKQRREALRAAAAARKPANKRRRTRAQTDRKGASARPEMEI